MFAGKLHFSSAATAAPASNVAGSTLRVAVSLAPLISTVVTPGNEARVFLTVARQPPHVIPGIVNRTRLAVAGGREIPVSSALSVTVSVTAGADRSGCPQPAIKRATRRMGSILMNF